MNAAKSITTGNVFDAAPVAVPDQEFMYGSGFNICKIKINLTKNKEQGPNFAL